MTSRSLHKDDIIIVSHPAHNHSLLLALAGPLRNANTHVEVYHNNIAHSYCWTLLSKHL